MPLNLFKSAAHLQANIFKRKAKLAEEVKLSFFFFIPIRIHNAAAADYLHALKEPL